jgi:two-component system CheB/CheR fusion protein
MSRRHLFSRWLRDEQTFMTGTQVGAMLPIIRIRQESRVADGRVLNEPRERGITMHTDLQWDPGHVTLKTEDRAIRPAVDRSQPAGRASTREELSDSTGQNVASRPFAAPKAVCNVREGVADTLAMPLLVLDTDLRVEFANRSFCEAFGVRPAEAVGRSIEEVGRGHWNNVELREALGHSLLHTGRGDELEIHCATVTSGPRTMRITTQTLAEMSDPGGYVLLAMEDVTGRQAMDRLQRDFVGLISHEMSNALTLVVGEAQCMQRRGQFNARALTSIVDQAVVLGRLVQDLLDTPSFDPDTLSIDRRWIDLADVARTTMHWSQTASPIHTMRLECPLGGVEGSWDRDRLTQVFSNLLSNAIRYSPAGGQILVSLQDLGFAARVSIRDQGIGIRPEALRHLFDQSYRVPGSAGQVRGLGLGLYITRMLVEATVET